MTLPRIVVRPGPQPRAPETIAEDTDVEGRRVIIAPEDPDGEFIRDYRAVGKPFHDKYQVLHVHVVAEFDWYRRQYLRQRLTPGEVTAVPVDVVWLE